MTGLQITTESGDGWHRVVPVGEVDLTSADQLRAAIEEIAGSTVVVDLSGVTFMDSSGIAALVAARRQVEADGNGLVLRGAQGVVRRVFQVLSMEDWLTD